MEPNTVLETGILATRRIYSQLANLAMRCLNLCEYMDQSYLAFFNWLLSPFPSLKNELDFKPLCPVHQSFFLSVLLKGFINCLSNSQILSKNCKLVILSCCSCSRLLGHFCFLHFDQWTSFLLLACVLYTKTITKTPNSAVWWWQ